MSDTLTIKRGDREVIDITVTGITNQRIAGATAKFSAKWRPDSGSKVIEKTESDGITIDTTGTDPKLVVVIAPVDTSWLPDQRIGLCYDVEVSPTDGSGPLTLVSDRLFVTPDVT